MTARVHYIAFAMLGAVAALTAVLFGPGFGGAAPSPFIDVASLARSLTSVAEPYLGIAAGAGAGVLIFSNFHGAVFSTWRGAVRAVLIIFNPVLIWAFAGGVDALFFLIASLFAWRGIYALAEQQNHIAIVSLGGALAVAGAASSYFFFMIPVLIAGTTLLSPWRLTFRGTMGVSLAVWSPLAMMLAAYFYIAWLAGGRMPLLSFAAFHIDEIFDPSMSIWSIPLIAPSLLTQAVNARAARPHRFAAAIIIMALLSGTVLSAAVGADPYIFAVGALAAQLAAPGGRRRAPEDQPLWGFAFSFAAGAILIAAPDGLDLLALLQARGA